MTIYRLRRFYNSSCQECNSFESVAEIFFETLREAKKYKEKQKDFTFKWSNIEKIKFNIIL